MEKWRGRDLGKQSKTQQRPYARAFNNCRQRSPLVGSIAQCLRLAALYTRQQGSNPRNCAICTFRLIGANLVQGCRVKLEDADLPCEQRFEPALFSLISFTQLRRFRNKAKEHRFISLWPLLLAFARSVWRNQLLKSKSFWAFCCMELDGPT